MHYTQLRRGPKRSAYQPMMSPNGACRPRTMTATLNFEEAAMPQKYTQHMGPGGQADVLPGMVPNSAGGAAYPVDQWKKFERFLVLGAEGGSYYATERALVRENAAATEACLA